MNGKGFDYLMSLIYTIYGSFFFYCILEYPEYVGMFAVSAIYTIARSVQYAIREES